MPSQMCLKTWLQQHDAPPHSSEAVIEFLNLTFGQQWIGWCGPMKWPPRSPDLGDVVNLKSLLWYNALSRCSVSTCFVYAPFVVVVVVVGVLGYATIFTQPFSHDRLCSKYHGDCSSFHIMRWFLHFKISQMFSTVNFLDPKTMRTCGVKCA